MLTVNKIVAAYIHHPIPARHHTLCIITFLSLSIWKLKPIFFYSFLYETVTECVILLQQLHVPLVQNLRFGQDLCSQALQKR